MKRICVFCGSSVGKNKNYISAAQNLGAALNKRGLGLVYGGASIGLMGVIANTVIDGGGEVIGVMPEALAKREITHQNITELHIVKSMHERKALMSELSDGFIALPGGLGTFEEFFEVLTWAQLGIHKKPCGILNINGYYDNLFLFLNHTVSERLLKKEYYDMILEDKSPTKLLDKFKTYKPPTVKKWIDLKNT